MTMLSDTSKSSMIDATEALIAAGADWLTPIDAPALALLRSLARSLDAEPTAALATSYGTAYRALVKRAPKAAPPKSLLAAALEEAARS